MNKRNAKNAERDRQSNKVDRKVVEELQKKIEESNASNVALLTELEGLKQKKNKTCHVWQGESDDQTSQEEAVGDFLERELPPELNSLLDKADSRARDISKSPAR